MTEGFVIELSPKGEQALRKFHNDETPFAFDEVTRILFCHADECGRPQGVTVTDIKAVQPEKVVSCFPQKMGRWMRLHGITASPIGEQYCEEMAGTIIEYPEASYLFLQPASSLPLSLDGVEWTTMLIGETP